MRGKKEKDKLRVITIYVLFKDIECSVFVEDELDTDREGGCLD